MVYKCNINFNLRTYKSNNRLMSQEKLKTSRMERKCVFVFNFKFNFTELNLMNVGYPEYNWTILKIAWSLLCFSTFDLLLMYVLVFNLP